MIRSSSVNEISSLYSSLLAGDDGAATDTLDDASILHLSGRSGLAGDYQGREAILGLLRRTTEFTGGTLYFSSSGVVAEGARLIVMRGRMRATRVGRHLDTDVLHVLSLRDEKIREVWVFGLNQDQFDVFWSGQ